LAQSTRTARGDYIDFELLAIKAQLAAKPTPKSVIDRREAIEEREGIKSLPSPAVEELLALSNEAALASAKAAPKRK
jgi:hypothetical protein